MKRTKSVERLQHKSNWQDAQLSTDATVCCHCVLQTTKCISRVTGQICLSLYNADVTILFLIGLEAAGKAV